MCGLLLINVASRGRSTGDDRGPLGFFDLPAEIRNKIAGYILKGHHICPTPGVSEDWTNFVRTHRSSRAPGLRALVEKQLIRLLRRKVSTKHLIGVRATQWDPRLKPTYAFQFLATCSRVYNDYFICFYRCNHFFLAPGNPDVTALYFDNLQPKHWLLIPHIIVYFGVLDITPHAMVSIEYGTRHVWNLFRAFMQSPTTRTEIRFLVLVRRYLVKCWTDKLRWLRREAQGKAIVLFARDQKLLFVEDPICHHLGADITYDMNGVCPPIRSYIAAAWLKVIVRIDVAVRAAFGAHADGMIPHHKKAIDAFRDWLIGQEKEEYLDARMECFAGYPSFTDRENIMICCEGFTPFHP